MIDLAQDMIRLSGFSPEDIQIRYTGLRPGEKLYEELRFEDEEMLPTSHDKLQIAYHRPFDDDIQTRIVSELPDLFHSPQSLIEKLSELVPEYRRPEAPAMSSEEIPVTENVLP